MTILILDDMYFEITQIILPKSLFLMCLTLISGMSLIISLKCSNIRMFEMKIVEETSHIFFIFQIVSNLWYK